LEEDFGYVEETSEAATPDEAEWEGPEPTEPGKEPE
jgi:hypothetical protein